MTLSQNCRLFPVFNHGFQPSAGHKLSQIHSLSGYVCLVWHQSHFSYHSFLIKLVQLFINGYPNIYPASPWVRNHVWLQIQFVLAVRSSWSVRESPWRLAFHWRGFQWVRLAAYHSLTWPCGPKPRQWKPSLRPLKTESGRAASLEPSSLGRASKLSYTQKPWLAKMH